MQARETLAEIPDQFTSFMKTRGVKPNPPRLLRHQSTISHAPSPPPQGEDTVPACVCVCMYVGCVCDGACV